jgi:hypothetical protein
MVIILHLNFVWLSHCIPSFFLNSINGVSFIMVADCSLRGKNWMYIKQIKFRPHLQSRMCRGSGWLLLGLSPRKTAFDSGSVTVRFVVDKVAILQYILPVLLFSPVSVIPPMLHIHLQLHVAFTRRTKGESGNFPKNKALLEVGEH